MDEQENNHQNEQYGPSLDQDADYSKRDISGSADNFLSSIQPTIDTDFTQQTDLDNSNDEETAEELTADDINEESDPDDETQSGVTKSAVGWIAVILAAISFFIMPVIFGGAGVIVGFFARSRDAKTLGDRKSVV